MLFEPRAKGEHGKPFFTLQPKIHYNISHSGKYVVCVIAGEEVGIDIQEHRELDYEKRSAETGSGIHASGNFEVRPCKRIFMISGCFERRI